MVMVLDEVILVSYFSMLHALINRIICEASEIFAAFKIVATLDFFWPFPRLSLVIFKMAFFKSLAKISSKWILLVSTTAPGLIAEIILFYPRRRNIFRELFPTALCFVTSHVSMSLNLPINSAIFSFKNLNDPFF